MVPPARVAAVTRVTLLAALCAGNGCFVNIGIRADPNIYNFFISERIIVTMIGFALFLATMLTCGPG
jgi:hypothetical protein